MEGKGIAGRAIKITASVGGVAGIANDLLNPLIDFGWYATYTLLAVLVICILAILIKPLQQWFSTIAFPQPVAGIFKEYWAAPLIVVLTSMAGITAGAAMLTDKNSETGGVVAQYIPGVADLKQQLGIMNNKLDELIIVVKEGKKETSEDPRKELQNRGIVWSEDSFKEKIVACEKESIELFLQGKIRLNLYSGTNQNYMMRIVHDTPSECRIWLLETLSNYGILNLNRKINLYTAGSFENPQGDIPWLMVNSYFGIVGAVNRTQSKLAEQLKNVNKAQRDDPKAYEQAFEKITGRSQMQPISMVMESGFLPLAIWEGDEKLVRYLISKGANCNERYLEDAAYPKAPAYTPISEALRINNGSLPSYMNACA